MTEQVNYNDFEDEEEEGGDEKLSNALPIWGNEKTMNLNHLVLTNIQSSQYFKGEYFLGYSSLMTCRPSTRRKSLFVFFYIKKCATF